MLRIHIGREAVGLRAMRTVASRLGTGRPFSSGVRSVPCCFTPSGTRTPVAASSVENVSMFATVSPIVLPGLTAPG